MMTTVQARPVSPYARLFAIPGAKAFCFSGAVARLPMSMMSLGIVLALNHVYNNWTVAGSMSAVYILAVAAVTPLYARLFDRFGQYRVGRFALTLQVLSMLGFAAAVLMRVPIPWLFVLAVVMGSTQFAFGALVRTRWTYALRNEVDKQLLNTAYALEAAIDEVVFIMGPILSAFLATSVHPVSQLFVPTLACGIGGTIFLSLRDTQPPVMREVQVAAAPADDDDVRRAMASDDASNASRSGAGEDAADSLELRSLHRQGAKPKSVLLYPGIIPVLAVFVVFNVSFNAFDVSMTATMKAMGVEQFLGLQLAMFALGSLIGAFIFGSRQFKGSNWSHMILFLSLLTVGFIAFRLSMDNLVLLGAFEILAGLCVSPLFATGNLIVKDIVPASSLTEGFSWVTTAGTVGVAMGSTLAGAVIDASNPHVSMMIPWIATGCAIPLAVLGWVLSKRSRKRDAEQSHEN